MSEGSSAQRTRPPVAGSPEVAMAGSTESAGVAGGSRD